MLIAVETKEAKQVVDITDQVQERVDVENGICFLNALHTTVALTTADLDPNTDQDYLNALEAIVPQLSYNHPHDPSHFPDHLLSTMIGTDLTIPVENGKLQLGTWQRIVLIEFDGPQKRNLSVVTK